MSQIPDTEPVWDKENPVPEKWIQTLDDEVLAKLPKGTKVIGLTPHGKSYWTRTAEVKTMQADRSEVSFFLKVTQHDTGKAMVSGEFVSMSLLHEASPAITPKPIGWGTYAADPDVHYFLCEFLVMTNQVPDEQKLGKALADLHLNSTSPNGMYGFAIPTYQATIPQRVEWQGSWEVFFHNLMERILRVEWASQGPDKELKQLTEAIMTKVIPRLLRPLESGGRQIQPRLVHGDLWDGNTSSTADTNTPVIFDATCLYAHNELELAPWRPVRHRMGKPYMEAYHKNYPISAPEEDHDDRNTLYCMRFNICCSALYPGNLRYRKLVIQDMRYLVEKYPDSYEGWARERGETPAPRPKEL